MKQRHHWCYSLSRLFGHMCEGFGKQGGRVKKHREAASNSSLALTECYNDFLLIPIFHKNWLFPSLPSLPPLCLSES